MVAIIVICPIMRNANMAIRVQNVLGVCILNKTISRMITIVHTMLVVVATKPLAV